MDKKYLEFTQKLEKCAKCKLCTSRANVVIGYGKIPSKIMIIGEAPGEQEDIQGKPFVGKSGKLLTEFLDSVGIDRENDCYTSNICKCRPPKNRNPEQDEIDICKKYLGQQIVHFVRPRVIILLGSVALRTIINKKLSITKVRGKWYKRIVKYMDKPLYIIPLFHPSYLLRNQSKKEGSPQWLTHHDLDRIVHFLLEPF